MALIKRVEDRKFGRFSQKKRDKVEEREDKEE